MDKKQNNERTCRNAKEVKYSFLSDKEKDQCCKESNTDNTGQSEVCIGEWKDKLAIARNKKDKAIADYNKANETYNQATSWEASLKKWKENAEDTNEKAVEIHDELEQFIDAVKRTETVKTVEAVIAVVCLVKCIFGKVDELVQVSNTEDSMGMIQRLKQSIECNESLDANKKEKALNCILDFEKQMQEIHATQDELLTQLLEILRDANVLVEAIDKYEGGEKEGLCPSATLIGIQWQLQDLFDRISGCTTFAERVRLGMNKEEDTSSSCGTSQELPCEEDRINPPKPFLIISNEANEQGNNVKVAESDYYQKITELHNRAEKKTEQAKKDKVCQRELRDKAVTYFEGLNNAIQASEAAKSAK